MATYRDANDREWTIRLGVESGDRCRNETGVDFQNLDTLKILTDPGKLARACYILAGEPGEYQAFADGIDGNTLDRMEAAVWSEMENFSRGRVKPVLKAMREKGQAVQELALTKVLTEIGRETPEQLLERLTSGAGVTNSAAT